MRGIAARSAKRSATGLVGAVVAVMLMAVLTAGPAQAAVAPNVVCGYNDNINGRAGWQNCDATNDYIRTTNFIGGESFQCVPGWQWWDLGPTWFVSNSQLIGFC